MKRGLVFDIQRFSVHDGPGIRTVVFFKGCPLRCLWCQNPEGLRAFQEIAFYGERCVNARTCAGVCPRGAVSFNGAERIRWEACDRCGLCAEACPSGSLQVVGNHYEADELVAEVLRDQTFYQASGGGVTVSGGEPTLQADFLAHFLKRCKEERLHTAFETCGWTDWEDLASVVPYCDLVLYDVKAINPVLHKRLTSRDNVRILENLRRLVKAQIAVIPRVPLIPTLTATRQNLMDIAYFLRELGLPVVHLLPYHRLGETKIARLDRTLEPISLSMLSEMEVQAIAAVFHEAGLTAVVGGV